MGRFCLAAVLCSALQRAVVNSIRKSKLHACSIILEMWNATIYFMNYLNTIATGITVCFSTLPVIPPPQLFKHVCFVYLCCSVCKYESRAQFICCVCSVWGRNSKCSHLIISDIIFRHILYIILCIYTVGYPRNHKVIVTNDL